VPVYLAQPPYHQVGVERVYVFIGGLGEMIVRKTRIRFLAVAIDALTHRAAEGRFGPSAYAVHPSGVMLLEKIVPKGVGIGLAPAYVVPESATWQSLQLPMAASSAPSLRTRSSTAASDGNPPWNLPGPRVVTIGSSRPDSS
jgi:hypothetical protein